MTVVIIVTSPRPYRPLHLWSTFRGRQRTAPCQEPGVLATSRPNGYPPR